VYDYEVLYPVIKFECGNKKVADPRGIPLEQILMQKWCTICRKKGCWRALSYDESRWDE
jgi:hypothetical protein